LGPQVRGRTMRLLEFLIYEDDLGYPSLPLSARRLEAAFRRAFAVCLALPYSMYFKPDESIAWATFYAPFIAYSFTMDSFGASVLTSLKLVPVLVLSFLLSIGIIQSSCMIDNYAARCFAVAGPVLFLVFIFNVLPGFMAGQRMVGSIGVLAGTFSIGWSSNPPGCEELDWYGPLRLFCSMLVGLVIALVAVIIPWPRLATSELRRRIALQAQLARQLLGVVQQAFFEDDTSKADIAGRLLRFMSRNQSTMEQLLPKVTFEVCGCCRTVLHTKSVVDQFHQSLSCMRGMWAALPKMLGQRELVNTKFLSTVQPQCEQLCDSICCVIDDTVVAEHEWRDVDPELVVELQDATNQVDTAFGMARDNAFGSSSPQYLTPQASKSWFDDYCRYMVFFYSLQGLGKQIYTSEAISFATAPTTPPGGGLKGFCMSIPVCILTLVNRPPCCACPPSKDKFLIAFKHTLAVLIGLLFMMVPALAKRIHGKSLVPTYVIFLWGDEQGSTVSNCKHRLLGALMGCMFGWLVSIILLWDVDDAHPYASQHGWQQALVFVSLGVWSFVMGLWEGHRRDGDGRGAALSSFSIVLGVYHIPDWSGKNPHESIGFQAALYLQGLFISVAILTFVDMFVFPKKISSNIAYNQAKILKFIGEGIVWAVKPLTYEAALDEEEEDDRQDDLSTAMHIVIADVGRLSDGTHEFRFCSPDFQAGAYERALILEETIFRLITSLHIAARVVNENLSTLEVPLLVAQSLAKVQNFADAVQEALQDAAELWTERMRQGEGCSRCLSPFDATDLVESSYIDHTHVEEEHELLIADRDTWLTEALQRKIQIAPPRASAAVSTVRYLCARMTLRLGELEGCLKDIVLADTAEAFLK